jgi:hypothetical protein
MRLGCCKKIFLISSGLLTAPAGDVRASDDPEQSPVAAQQP